MQVVTPPVHNNDGIAYSSPDLLVIGLELRHIVAASDWNNGDIPDDSSNWNNPYGDTVL